MLAAAVACLLVMPACLADAHEVNVSTVEGLREALAGAVPGTTVRLAPGEYQLASPLVVPDNILVEGSGGQMVPDGDGSARGWRDDRVSTFRVGGPWSGNAIELGHGSALRRLRVVDGNGAGGVPTAGGEARNLVVVASRRAGDRVEASIVECEISTQQAFGSGASGPLGRAVAVWTRSRAGKGPSDAGASASLTIERSIIRAPRSNSLFAINFAPRGQVEVDIQDSRLEGVMSAAGGTSLRDHVTGAVTTIRTRNNIYVTAGGFQRFGWHLFGGSGVPHPQPGPATPPGADDNLLTMRSEGDRIEGYQTGILSAAGRRVGDLSGPSSGNRVELDLQGLTIRTEGAGAADLRWYGAVSEPPLGNGEPLPPGENNVLVARITSSLGSGPRANGFADLQGPEGPGHDAGGGNRLVIEGSTAAFLHDNRNILPRPDERFFQERRDRP